MDQKTKIMHSFFKCQLCYDMHIFHMIFFFESGSRNPINYYQKKNTTGDVVPEPRQLKITGISCLIQFISQEGPSSNNSYEFRCLQNVGFILNYQQVPFYLNMSSFAELIFLYEVTVVLVLMCHSLFISTSSVDLVIGVKYYFSLF